MSIIMSTGAHSGLTSSVTSSSGLTITYSQNDPLNDLNYNYGTAESVDSDGAKYKLITSRSKKRRTVATKYFFGYVKSKISKRVLKDLESEIEKLGKLFKQASEIDQTGLRDALAKRLMTLMLKQQARAQGFELFISKSDIEKYRGLVSDSEIEFCKLENYPRPIPDKVRKKLMAAQRKQVFTEYHVLYTDQTGEVMKSTKQQIKEKDPILFGSIPGDDGNYYYIADWVDEYCDLTLDKLVDRMKEETDTESSVVGKTEKLTDKELEEVLLMAKIQANNLYNTKPSNYKDLMKAEDLEDIKRKAIQEYKENEIFRKFIKVVSEKAKAAGEKIKEFFIRGWRHCSNRREG